MAFNTEQHREYQKQRRLDRLAMAVDRLGGKCVRCGTVEDLQFDHVDPATKLRKVSEATNWSMERFLAEVDKCQLLCPDCHAVKSMEAGELNGGRKLTAENVKEIRLSPLTDEVLAGKFGVLPGTIQAVRARKTWQHLS